MTATPTMASKQYHHGDLRAAALAAARDLLEERGPSFLNMREIARRIGVSAPALYHHFPNLEAIALGIAELGAVELDAAITETQDAGNLLDAGEAYVAFAQANPALYRLMFGEGFAKTSTASDAIRTLRQNTYRRIEARLAGRYDDAHVRNAALFLWSLTHGLALLLIDGQIPDHQRAGLVRDMLGLARHGVAGQNTAA